MLDYVYGATRFDGLETLFLTVLAAINMVGDQRAFERGMQAWDTFGAHATVPGAGPMGFYNVIDRR
jgi:hypothetical protein